MTYREAMNLHVGDQVIVKKTEKMMTVTGIFNRIERKEIILVLDGYDEYLHNEVR